MYFLMSNLPRMKAEMFRGLGLFLWLSFIQYFTAHALPSPPAAKRFGADHYFDETHQL